jgi:hypothetical protein
LAVILPGHVTFGAAESTTLTTKLQVATLALSLAVHVTIVIPA